MTSMQDNTAAADHVDLCIIGSGSGLSLIDDDINDWQIALIDNGIGPNDAFGGTCLNAGCIPVSGHLRSGADSRGTRRCRSGCSGDRLQGHPGPHVRPHRRHLGVRAGRVDQA